MPARMGGLDSKVKAGWDAIPGAQLPESRHLVTPRLTNKKANLGGVRMSRPPHPEKPCSSKILPVGL